MKDRNLCLRIIIYLSFIHICPCLIYGQHQIPDTLASSFNYQLTIFPQEKIYLHTDKPYYISGEKIWFRAHLADAVTHTPALVSRYVYVELINPLDSIVSRIKIRQEEDAFYGHLSIPDDLPEGDYTIRAYTLFMQSQDEHYFCTKSIHIGDPQARIIHTETNFFFESDRKIHTSFRFSYVATSEPLIPQSVMVSVNDGKQMTVNVDGDGTATINFTLPATSRQRTMLLEVKTGRVPFRQFIQIPAPNNDFEVSFYPEGGSLMLGTLGKVVFKAMKSNGQSADISGVVYNQVGTEVRSFKSEHSGMGSFSLLAKKGETYYAVCQNDQGESKRFVLPAAIDNGYALSVNQVRNNLYISVLQPSGVGVNSYSPLHLMAHTRGMVHLIEPWDQEKNMAVIPNNLFPSGVLHLILFDSKLHPVSERLVFINNNDQAQVTYHADNDHWERRSLVKSSVRITDSDGMPISGNFSVAITSDREVTVDSTSNILIQLLLTSDLRGYIENPAYYFQDSPRSSAALDLLMCTQGWRRYDVTAWSQGRFSTPSFPIEAGNEISGTVKSVIQGKPVDDAVVTVVSLSQINSFFNTTNTDKNGRFHLPIGELPDSTQYMISVEPKKGVSRMELLIDRETFPERTLPATPFVQIERNRFLQYADKAELQYIYEGGIRVVELSAAIVTANRTPPRKSQLYTNPDASITEEQIEKNPAQNMINLLGRIPGIQIVRDPDNGLLADVVIRGPSSFQVRPEKAEVDDGRKADIRPLVLIDDIPCDFNDLNLISVHNIAQIDILKNAGNTAIFGSRGGPGVIVVYTKRGGNVFQNLSNQFHIKTLTPLGYQQPIEFYAPKYETVAQRNSLKPDLRTTIHWQPVIEIDYRGIASFEFYTADEPTSYNVIIEGLSSDGSIIRHETKLWQRSRQQ